MWIGVDKPRRFGRRESSFCDCIVACPRHAIGNSQRAASNELGHLIQGSFDIGDRSLYISCSGAGSPTLILEPGDGGSSRDYQPIFAALVRDHRVCRYDRANTGRSGKATQPRPAAELASDLHALLAAAKVPGPYLVVGTSIGGLSAYEFGVLHPDETAGFIAINPPPDPDEWLPAVKPLVTAQEYADEVAYATGAEGDERIDATGYLSTSPPASMPYRIVDSSKTQCEGDQLCLKVYNVIIDETKDMASRGAGGAWLQIPGSHQLQLSNPDAVVGVIRDVEAAIP